MTCLWATRETNNALGHRTSTYLCTFMQEEAIRGNSPALRTATSHDESLS